MNNLVREVVLDGLPLNEKRKWLERYCRLEDADFESLWNSMNQLLSEVGLEKPDKKKMLDLASQCLLTEETVESIMLPRVYLRRRYNKPGYCIGRLFIEDGTLFFCDTLEPHVTEEGDGASDKNDAVPSGTYQVRFASDEAQGEPSLGKALPYLCCAPCYTRRYLRQGSSSEETRGDILLGFNIRVGRLADSRKVFEAFCHRMSRNPFILIITNDFERC